MGKAKRKYEAELIAFNKKLNRPLKFIKGILPKEYDSDIILDEFKRYYPFEWKEMQERYRQYSEKDNFLIQCGKKPRYKPLKAKAYLLSLPKVKYWLSKKGQVAHSKHFNKRTQLNNIRELEVRRKKKISRTVNRINQFGEKLQEIEPLYIDAFIAAYHQKGISINGKIEIFNELKKYNTDKVVDFFYKLNDAERNDQIRNMAFQHLQSLGKYVKLRGKYKGKKKEYMTERSDFNMTPIDLWSRINSDSIQNKKIYDVFISHSSKDSDVVINTIKCLNKIGLNVYCDWTSDDDFLKKDLVSDYTIMVIKKRLKQSKKLLLLQSQNSISSKWVEFELSFFRELDKPMYFINIDCSNFRPGSFAKELEYNFNSNYIQKLNE